LGRQIYIIVIINKQSL